MSRNFVHLPREVLEFVKYGVQICYEHHRQKRKKYLWKNLQNKRWPEIPNLNKIHDSPENRKVDSQNERFSLFELSCVLIVYFMMFVVLEYLIRKSVQSP